LADEPVTVTTAHRVTRGRENDFRAWATGLLRDAADSEDYLGGGILSPGDNGGDWHIVYRWSSENAARRWEVSAIHAEWMAQAVRFTSPAGTRLTSGVRAWFDLPSRVVTPPPKWKSALVTLTAVFPAVLLFNVTLIPFLSGLSVIVRTLVLCVGVTVVVTWVMMPRLMPLFRNWLHPPPLENGAHRAAAAVPRRQPDVGPAAWTPAGPPGRADGPRWLEVGPTGDTTSQPEFPRGTANGRPWYARQPPDDDRDQRRHDDRYDRYPQGDWRQEDDEPDPRRYDERMSHGRLPDQQWPQHDRGPREWRR
jgi:antibiotic biosynthesis monooxygenase (ABM) superfamily enzyme